MPTFSTIPCSEKFATLNESFGRDGIKMDVVLYCEWQDRHDLITDLLLNKREYPSLTLTHPPRAVSASCGPMPTRFATIGQTIVYDVAEVSVSYSTEITDTISESLEPTAKFQTLDYRRFRWGSTSGDPILEAEAPGKLVRGLNLVRTYYHLDPPLPTELLTLYGSCNNTAYVSSLLGLTFPAETLLFEPPSLSRAIKSNGEKAFNLTLKFNVNYAGWNTFWRAETGAYERIYDVDNGQYDNYPLEDFSALLA